MPVITFQKQNWLVIFFIAMIKIVTYLENQIVVEKSGVAFLSEDSHYSEQLLCVG